MLFHVERGINDHNHDALERLVRILDHVCHGLVMNNVRNPLSVVYESVFASHSNDQRFTITLSGGPNN
jgi:hypothetical protein